MAKVKRGAKRANRTVRIIFTWSALNAKWNGKDPLRKRIYYYSVRPVNNLSNSVADGKYKSASGRNDARVMYCWKFPGTKHANMSPKAYLAIVKDQKKK